MESLSNEDLFRLFVLEHQQAVMVHLGKMVHPGTGKIERNLEAARVSIDLLGMLSAKTKGNLSPDEDRLLSQVLTTLRMNYVEEARRVASEPQAHEGEEPPEQSAEAGSPQPEQDLGSQQESPSSESQGG
jgi:hypothetical protein